MPTYDYVCSACDHELEVFQSMSEAPKRKCPECGALKLKRQIGTGGGLIFKGSGFYLTDYRSDSYKQGAEAEKKGSEPPSSEPSSSEPKSEPKSDAKSGSAGSAAESPKKGKRAKKAS